MAKTPHPTVIGYFNHNIYPVSFTGLGGSQLALEPGEALLSAGLLVPPNRICDSLVQDGMLRAILDDNKKYARYAPRNNHKVAASASVTTAAEANLMPASEVKTTNKTDFSTGLIPESTVSSTNGVVITLPSGAVRKPNGSIEYNGIKFTSDAAFKAYLQSRSGTND